MNEVLVKMKEQLEKKELELKTNQEHILVYAETELSASNYEKNTMLILNNMIEIKVEINTLKHWIRFIENIK
jgi:hypothetical protein